MRSQLKRPLAAKVKVRFTAAPISARGRSRLFAWRSCTLESGQRIVCASRSALRCANCAPTRLMAKSFKVSVPLNRSVHAGSPGRFLGVLPRSAPMLTFRHPCAPFRRTIPRLFPKVIVRHPHRAQPGPHRPLLQQAAPAAAPARQPGQLRGASDPCWQPPSAEPAGSIRLSRFGASEPNGARLDSVTASNNRIASSTGFELCNGIRSGSLVRGSITTLPWPSRTMS